MEGWTVSNGLCALCAPRMETPVAEQFTPTSGREPAILVGPIRVRGTRGQRVVGMKVGDTYRRMSLAQTLRLIGALQAAISDALELERAANEPIAVGTD